MPKSPSSRGGAAPYRKGAAFENRVVALLRRRGCQALRATVSGRRRNKDEERTPFDILAVDPDGWVHFVECKLAGRLSPSDRAALIALADRYPRSIPILATLDKDKDVQFTDLRTGRPFAYVAH